MVAISCDICARPPCSPVSRGPGADRTAPAPQVLLGYLFPRPDAALRDGFLTLTFLDGFFFAAGFRAAVFFV
jgi:hypothetical protein